LHWPGVPTFSTTYFVTMPDLVKRAKWLKELNEQPDVPFKFPSPRSDDCFCVYCEKAFVGAQKSQLVQHMKGERHKANQELKKKRTASQATLEQIVAGGKRQSRAENFSTELCEAFLAAGIPIWKLENPVLRQFLEKTASLTVPHESTLRKKYMDKCYDKILEEMKADFSTGNLWVSADCSKDAQFREVANIIIGKLHHEKFSPPYLVTVDYLEKADADTMARIINHTLCKIDPNLDSSRVKILLSDAAPYMVKCGRTLQVFYPLLVHITCVAHALSLVCEKAPEIFKDVNRLIASMKLCFVKSPNRRALYRDGCPDLPLPPEPVVTR